MLLLDVLIRYSTVTLAITIAVLALRDGYKHQPSRFAAYLSICLACVMLVTAPPELKLPMPFYAIVRFMDVPILGLVWWLGLSMFDDDFKLGKLEWAGMAAVALPIFAFRLAQFDIISRPPELVDIWISSVSLLLMAHLFYSTLRDRKDDMVEARRRMRLYFVISIAIAGASTIIAEILFDETHRDAVDLFRAAVALPMVLWGILWLANFHPERLNFRSAQKVTPDRPAIDPRDQVLHDNLIALMRDDKAYTEPGLTIRTLAENLKTPEHQLRALINKGMGYRNFSGFLNQYRIDAVIEQMKQPENARIPVLTLAMDVGFNSLAPFNRAFRNITGKTPTQYRANLINKNNG